MPRADWWVDYGWREKLLEEGYKWRELDMMAFRNVFVEDLFDDIRRWLKKEKHFIILEDTPRDELKASNKYEGIELMVHVDEIVRYVNSSETRVFFTLMSKKEDDKVSDFIKEFWEHAEKAAKQNSAVPRANFKTGCVTCGRPLEPYSILCSECTEKYRKHRAGEGLSRLSDFVKEVLKKADDFEKEGKYAEANEQYSLLSKAILDGLTLPSNFLLTTINENEGLRYLAAYLQKKAQKLYEKVKEC